MGSLKRLSKRMSFEHMGFKRKVKLDGMVFLPQPGLRETVQILFVNGFCVKICLYRIVADLDLNIEERSHLVVAI